MRCEITGHVRQSADIKASGVGSWEKIAELIGQVCRGKSSVRKQMEIDTVRSQ